MRGIAAEAETYLDPTPLQDWLEDLAVVERSRLRARGQDPEEWYSALGRRFGVDRKTIRRWVNDPEYTVTLTLTRADAIVCHYGDPSVLYALWPDLADWEPDQLALDLVA